MIKLMKPIFTFIFLVLSIISYSQKNKENLDKEILRLLNKYFSTTISSSSILSQNSGGNPILATREFKIKNDTLFIYFQDKKDFLTGLTLSDTSIIPFNEIHKVLLQKGVGNDESPAIAVEFFKKKYDRLSISNSGKNYVKELSQINGANISQKMNGQIAGVNVGGDNSPGGIPKVRIRGISSLLSNNDPLYIVDDVPIKNINIINPDDIASVEILKEASATSFYGVRGANGVVLIKTKKDLESLSSYNQIINEDLSFSIWVFGKLAKEIKKLNDDKKLIQILKNRTNLTLQ